MSESTDIRRTVGRPDSYPVEQHEWGRLVWMANRSLGISETMTVGRCYIDPGKANPRHRHANCDEVLYVLTGSIEHSLGDDTFPMQAGDIVSIPCGTMHNARNVGDEVAEFVICYNSADRQTEGE
ncbi:cupin domain-containing protein [Microlunatus soli]|uniref:Cupin domain-containing protein n=1 Tax=Microlunatus soli TaxID=630515 RepID=A0A1H1PSN4_9ACTN|nr:cupin domain-containing protein [Microlunatus soli]SDS14282.1 Cupin domain-containing protein [Microlunatus soli]